MAGAAVNALNALLRSTSIDDHDEALKLANAALEKSGASAADKLTALHTKVVALLHLDRFGDALRTIAGAGDALAARCVLEHAYALYKAGDQDAAEALATRAAADHPASRALRHVAAQAAYRAERFDRAAALYATLAAAEGGAANAGEDADVRINTLAVAAQQAWQQGSGGGGAAAAAAAAAGAGAVAGAERREDLESFETAYNAGSGALARGDVARGLVLLRRAEQLCAASEDLGDDDKRAELLPILIQQTYALARLGRLAEAAALQKKLEDEDNACEGAASVVAATNGVLVQHGAATAYNPYVVQRQIEAIPAPPAGSDRLFAHQARILRRNQYTIELQCYRFKGVRSRTAQKLKAALAADKENRAAAVDPDAVDLGVFHAAAATELQTGREALRRIRALLASRPDDVGLLLTAVQLHLQGSGKKSKKGGDDAAAPEEEDKTPAGNVDAALALLEAFFQHSTKSGALDVRFAPGLVALAVALYRLQGRANAVRSELASAVAHWQQQQQQQKAGRAPLSLLRAAGVELLRSPNPADQAVAAAAFETLHAANPADRIAAAGLVATVPQADAAAAPAAADAPTAEQAGRAARLSTLLTPVDELVKNVDVARLLQGGVATLAAPATAATATASSRKRTATDEPAPPQQQQTAKKPKTSSKQGGAAASDAAAGTPVLSRQARKLQAKAAAAAAAAAAAGTADAAATTFDPNKKMDPERWLALRDRSSYRPPKGKKKGRRGGGDAGTMQGGVVKEEETLALAGGAGSVRVEKAPAGGSAAAKKRKKGKK